MGEYSPVGTKCCVYSKAPYGQNKGKNPTGRAQSRRDKYCVNVSNVIRS